MADAFLRGNGGSNLLNLKVVGGTSTPSNPAENTIWINTNTAIHSWNFSATEPCRRSKNRNLLTYPYYHTTMTTNGITFTDNKDGTVTANGKSTAQARFRPFHQTVESGKIWLNPGTYFVSGCPSGGSASTYLWEAFDADNNVTLAKDYGNGAKFTLAAGTHVRGSIIIQSGVTVSNQVWRPQIENGSTATSFVKGDATGQVWIQTNIRSILAFNALKKNKVMVYPKIAKQYINGAWTEKPILVYKASEWRKFQNAIVPDVNRVWAGSKATFDQTEAETVITITLKSSANGAKSTAEGHTEIDLTGYSTLYVKGGHSVNNTSGSAQNWWLRLCNASGDSVSTIFSRGEIPERTDLGYQAFEKTIDVSSLSGIHLIKTYGETWSTVAVPHIVTITSAYLE